jgi:integrase/recombinase XerD
MATVNLFIKSNKTDRQGKSPIILRIFHKGKSMDKTLDFRVDAKHWDSAKQRVIPSSNPNWKNINTKLSEIVNEAHAVLENQMSDTGFNRGLIKQRLDGYNVDSVTEFWKTKFNEFVVSGYAEETARSFASEYKKFESFAKDITFNELTPEFILRYQAYMRVTLKNADSTIRKSMKRLKRVLVLAEQLLDIELKCFKHYTMPKAISNVESLEYSEVETLLKALMNDGELTGMYRRTLEVYLLQCFTGMRYSNAAEFDPNKHIKNNWVDFVSLKTGERVYVPFHDNLQILLNLTGGIFNAPANAVMNRNLKDIAFRYGINRKLTTHTAVHTFCTVSIELGVPVEVVQKWRGHKNINTTMIYTHIRDAHSKDMMKNWDNALDKIILTRAF